MHGIERLLTADDVCSLLRIKKSYLYALTSENRIPHFKIGGFLRFRQSELEAWLTDNAEGGDHLLLAEEETRYGRS
ncbi:MAG: helix-turn-helix domain-containing protein [Candidatus Poribacteria bacterium]|nr:helix-turn-helix domain-containing protein [Candidatus Poribacteria bacterium]